MRHFSHCSTKLGKVQWDWHTDLLDGKYQTPDTLFGIQTIAEWAGNSPKVILRYYGRVRPKMYHQVTQFNEQIKNGTPVETFFKRNTLENAVSNALTGVAPKPAPHTAVQGGIEGNDESSDTEGNELKPLKIQCETARNRIVGNLTESPYFNNTERTGFEPAELIQVHGFSKPAH